MSDDLPPPPQYPPPPGSYPPPGPPGPPAGSLADWAPRAGGLLLDSLIGFAILVVGIIVGAILGAVASALGALVLILTYVALLAYEVIQIIKQGRTGQTIGQKIVGLRLVNERTGQPIGGGMAFVRSIAHIVDSLICYVGWLFPLWDTKRQTLADKIVGTVVVTVPKQPFDTKDLLSTS
jgi:uncharacterized RDD family membrane protein YckC